MNVEYLEIGTKMFLVSLMMFNESPFCSWFLPIATSIVIRSLWGLKISMHFASRKRLHNAKIRPDINSLMQFSLVTLFMFCSEEVGRSLHAASWNSCTENMETLRAESELRNAWKYNFFSWSWNCRACFSWFKGFMTLNWSIYVCYALLCFSLFIRGFKHWGQYLNGIELIVGVWSFATSIGIWWWW